MTNEKNAHGQQTPGTQRELPSGTSPELTGGQGFSFEDAVSSVYAAALLCEMTAPGLPGRIVRHVSVQQGPFGHPLDDLVVRAEGTDQVSITFSAQVKRKLVISAANTNTDFRETIERAYETVSHAGFLVSLDRVGAIAGEIANARTQPKGASRRFVSGRGQKARRNSSSVSCRPMVPRETSFPSSRRFATSSRPRWRPANLMQPPTNY